MMTQILGEEKLCIRHFYWLSLQKSSNRKVTRARIMSVSAASAVTSRHFQLLVMVDHDHLKSSLT